MENIIIEKGDNATVYEVSYLLLPSLALEQVPGKAAALKDALTSLGGEIISLESPVLIDLSYSMTKVVQTTRHKVSKAYFGWMKFEMGSEEVEKVKKALDIDADVLRYLIVKTVRENTLLNGKMKLGREEKMKEIKEGDEVEGVIEPSKEENPQEDIDKSIDELVIA